MAFRASWYRGGVFYEGLYTDYGGPLCKIVDTSDILVEGLSASSFKIEESVNQGGRSIFNDRGQVVFWAQLTDGRTGIFLATPEEQTLATISSFTVTAFDKAIIIKWATESEIDNAGFNLYRSGSEYGSYTKINDALYTGQRCSHRRCIISNC